MLQMILYVDYLILHCSVLPNSKDMLKYKGVSMITPFSEPVTNLKDLYEKVGHQGDDLIYKWVT